MLAAMSWVRTLVGAAIAVAVAPAAALAHAVLVSAEPQDGAVLATPPAQITLTFDEPVTPQVLLLVGPDGASTRATGRVLGSALQIAIPQQLPRGTHVLSWRVSSSDGHPVGGSQTFSIGAASVGIETLESERLTPLQAAIWVARVLVYLGMMFGVGGAVVGVWNRGKDGDRSKTLTSTLLALGVTGAVLGVGLQGLDLHGQELQDLLGVVYWRTGIFSSYGLACVMVIAAALFAGAATRMRGGTAARSLSVIALTALGLSFTSSGHASAASPQWLALPLVFAHAAALALWLGALAPLAGACAASRGRELLSSFSGWIGPVIDVLIVSGAGLLLIQAGSWALLTSSTYGNLLALKLSFVCVLFAIAAINRWALSPAVERGSQTAERRLVATIVGEVVVALLILAVVAGWRFTPPPRVAAVATPQFQIHMHGTTSMANVALVPGRVGPVKVLIAPKTLELRPLDAVEVVLIVSSDRPGIEPLRRKAVPRPGGVWEIDDLALPFAGRWQLSLFVLVDALQEELRLEAVIDLKG